MSRTFAQTLFKDPTSTLDDLREAVTTLEDVIPIARRVLGSTHPTVSAFGSSLRNAQAILRARETPPPGGSA